MKRLTRRTALLAGMAMLAVSACAVDQALPPPSCLSGASWMIVAQSVPGAEQVPCLDILPRGWDIERVTIGQDGTVISLDSDRAGGAAAELHYAATCQAQRGVSVPSDQDGAEAFEFIEQLSPSFRGERYYTFAGGCVWWRFDFDEGTSAALSIELGNSLSLVSRRELNETIAETFIDEEL